MIVHSRKDWLKSSTALTTVFLVLVGTPTTMLANPKGGKVVAGQATISQPNATTVEIQQHTQKAIVDWRSFNIAPNETTKIVQPNSSAWILNRINGAHNPTVIQGRLEANGNVAIVNPDGIVFSKGSRVDVHSLIATTSNISNNDFMAGRMNFNQPGNAGASVINEGNISIGDYGLGAFVAPGVRNSGVITARFGSISLASGNIFTLDLYGDGLINLAIDDEITKEVIDVATGKPMSDLVKNEGTIKANGGIVALKAATARRVVNSVINNTGVIEANTIEEKDGMIIMGAQTASTKTPSAPRQRVKVSGRLIASTRPTRIAIPTARPQHGGKIEITGESIELRNALLKATGAFGGGTILIGGDYMGGNGDPAIVAEYNIPLEGKPVPTATFVNIAENVTINADATDNGKGGKVIVWSDYTTTVQGTISARGGANGGDGGFVETSGKYFIDASANVDASATIGKAGTWLLDPETLTILASSNTRFDFFTPVTSGGVTTFEFKPGRGPTSGSIRSETLNKALDTGTDVHLLATKDITWAPFSTNLTGPPIVKSVAGSSTLKMTAGNEINLQRGSISAKNGGTLNVTFEASKVVLNIDRVNLGGGNLRVNAAIGYQLGTVKAGDFQNILMLFLTNHGQPTYITNNSLGYASTVSSALISGILSDTSTFGLTSVSIISYGGDILVDEKITKTGGGTSNLHFAGPGLDVQNSILSTFGGLNFSYGGLGDSSVFTMSTGIRDGKQVRTDIDTNGGIFFASAVALQMPNSVTYSDGSLPFDTPLVVPSVNTRGGGVTLNFQDSPNSRTVNNFDSGYNNHIGCQTSNFCANSSNFVIDAGGGPIQLSSDTLATDVNDMPLVILSDRALRTTGMLLIRQVNVDERAPAFLPGGAQFDGPGNGVNAAEFGTLNLKSGAFDVLDVNLVPPPPPPKDEPPTVGDAISDQKVTDDGTWTGFSSTNRIFADDGGVGSLTLTAANVPAGVKFTDNGDGTFTLTPISKTAGSLPVGSHTITVTATDASGGSVSTKLKLVVTAPPPPPPPPKDEPPTVGEAISDQKATDDGTWTGFSSTNRIFADDGGVGSLTLTAANVPAGVKFTDNGDGTFTLTPISKTAGSLPVGSHTITVTATDASGGSVSTKVNLIVAAPPPPPPPPKDNPPTVGEAISDEKVTDDGTWTGFSSTNRIFADDGGVGSLTLTPTNLPTGVKFTDNGDGTFTLTPISKTVGSLPVGSHTITVTATDASGGSISTTIKLVVAAPPPPPPQDNPPTVGTGTVADQTLVANDTNWQGFTTSGNLFADDGLSALNITVDPASLPVGVEAIDNVDGSVTFSLAPGVTSVPVGEYTIRILAVDGTGTQVEQHFTLLVVNGPVLPPTVGENGTAGQSVDNVSIRITAANASRIGINGVEGINEVALLESIRTLEKITDPVPVRFRGFPMSQVGNIELYSGVTLAEYLRTRSQKRSVDKSQGEIDVAIAVINKTIEKNPGHFNGNELKDLILVSEFIRKRRDNFDYSNLVANDTVIQKMKKFAKFGIAISGDVAGAMGWDLKKVELFELRGRFVDAYSALQFQKIANSALDLIDGSEISAITRAWAANDGDALFNAVVDLNVKFSGIIGALENLGQEPGAFGGAAGFAKFLSAISDMKSALESFETTTSLLAYSPDSKFKEFGMTELEYSTLTATKAISGLASLQRSMVTLFTETVASRLVPERVVAQINLASKFVNALANGAESELENYFQTIHQLDQRTLKEYRENGLILQKAAGLAGR